MIGQPRRFDSTQVAATREELARAGVRTVVGAIVNAAGMTLAKGVPLARLEDFHRTGMGAAPVWHVFSIDGGIAFTESIGVVGDMRLRLDLDALRSVGGGLAWGPASFVTQAGEPDRRCARGLLGGVERRLAEAGLAARVGHELEFVLLAADGSALTDGRWVPYGATGLLDREAFLEDVLTAAGAAGIEVEQTHAEYGPDQFELSLAPAAPLAAADAAVLTKMLVGRVARRHQLRVSFSPVPFVGAVGNGAHQHVSLSRDGGPLFAGGDGPHGITDDGGAAIGGIVRALPDIQGLLTGSVLSGQRLAPGLWSGVHCCWGLENREAAVRFVCGPTGNPSGANVEVKVIDPSANVYVASAAVLAAALDGVTTNAALPPDVGHDPAKTGEQHRGSEQVTVLPDDVATVIGTLERSRLARLLVGDEIVAATVATRRYEQDHHAAESPQRCAERFRLAWTI